MSEIIAWIAAEEDRREIPAAPPSPRQPADSGEEPERPPISLQHLPLHQFPARRLSPMQSEIPAHAVESSNVSHASCTPQPSSTSTSAYSIPGANTDWTNDPLYTETDIESEIYEQQRRRRVYRGRTAAMLHRYMRYSLETGRIPSILGGDIFRSRVTSYGVSTFEDRAIFVHDMEKCLNRLDELSRQVLARVVLQGHNHHEAARLFGCTRMTIHRNLMEALDRMAEILLEVGLLAPLPTEEHSSTDDEISPVEKSCQGGEATDFLLSDCDDGK